MTGIYRMAELNIRICSRHELVHRYCEEYRSEGAPELLVEISQADIDYERARAARTREQTGERAREDRDDYLELLAVYRRIAEQLPARGVVLFHGSAVAVDGTAYLFTASSGTGKSTHARLWREMLGERAVMINDDKPLLRITEKAVTVYGTPYNGKHRLGANLAAPLKALCILERAAENSIREISYPEACPVLLQQVYRPADIAAFRQTLSLIDRLAGSVRLYRMGCNMDPQAARIAYEKMKG